MQQTLKLNKPNPLMTFLMDKWNIVGVLGTLMTGFSIPAIGIEGGLMTGIAGLAMTAVTVWQKYRQEQRNKEKHDLQMKVVNQILEGKIEVDKDVIAKFLD